eukprot:gb/GFBE01036859.1/.p1 GENE.gb/GFBE01036859.1/~~gb/GFBE01036859.1/.p1  ORF type:complete len:711 (+),score=113.62 gb/GFBE01036859.1/:1-2133(+)
MGGSNSIGGRAQLEETYFLQKVKLGQGTFGTVWRAKHRKEGHTVAIKQMDKASLPRRGVSRKDIEREVTMMKACSHDNITKLFDTFEDNASIYLALEYCDGGDFGDKVQEVGPVITELDTAEYMRQICAALHHLHGKGICHRDIKPDNFMVAQDNLLKLTDFGLAVYLPQGQFLTDKCGTPAFMSPEQHQMPKRSNGYGFPCDMWAAGVSMYMIIFGGRHPFLNSRGALDDTMLLSGTLDFTDTSSVAAPALGFFGLGNTILKFSDTARKFCKQMVEPNPAARLTASAAIRVPWLLSGRAQADEKKRLAQGRASSPEVSPQAIDAAGVRAGSATPLAAPSARKGSQGYAEGGYPAGGFTPQGGAAAAVGRFGMQAPKAPLPPPPRNDDSQRARELQQENQRLQMELQREKQQREEQHRQKEMEMSQFRAQAAQQVAFSVQPEVSRNMSGRLLTPGTKCRYEPTSSDQYGMLPAIVESFNESDGTFNLDVRPHADPNRIKPSRDVTSAEAWPRGVLVSYYSEQAAKWLPAVVKSFNDSDGTYNLDVREHADCERIRLRSGTREVAEVVDPSVTSAVRPSSKHRETVKNFVPSEALAMAAASGADSEGSSARVGPGDWCTVPDHGYQLAQISTVQNGLAELIAGGANLSVKVEALRAPKEERLAWRPGTAVSYSSSRAGTWIDATVESFNPHNHTYNLDVRQEADPDKVRPR